MRAKKSLGQHFLRSRKALEAVADACDIKEGETVVEIGPGHGELTEKLLERGARVIAVEKDEALAEELRHTFSQNVESGGLTIISGDITDFSPQTVLNGAHYTLVGNLPYYITGAVLRQFLTARHQPRRVVFLLQKEVVDRIMSDKGSLLSMSVQAYGTPRKAGVVKRGAFSPPPKVDSAILVIEDISRAFFTDIREEAFFAILRAGFGQKRKQLAGNLANTFKRESTEEAFTSCDIPATARAEDLSLESFRCLTERLSRAQSEDIA